MDDQSMPDRRNSGHADQKRKYTHLGAGVDEIPVDDLISRPFDPTLIRVSTSTMTVQLLLARINHDELDLAPSFQRSAGIWSKVAQSRLIESALIRIPLPAFYMDATNEDKWLVVDGLQRLSTFQRFVLKQELRLTDLEFLTDMQGRTFDELPRSLQRRIMETQVTVFLIEKDTPPEVKFNIFKRINTGGLPLSAQEIRHALNQGPVTRILADLAGCPEFRAATGESIQGRRMDDRECVLRFLAFATTPADDFRSSDLDTFLFNKMAELNRAPASTVVDLSERFRRAMLFAGQILGPTAFRKVYQKQGRRMPINKALFEAWSVNFDRLRTDELSRLVGRKEVLLDRFITLLGAREFDNAVSQGTGDIRKVHVRFALIKSLIQGVLA